MAERRRSAHAIDDQNNGGTLSAKKPRDPLSSYLYRSVVWTCTEEKCWVYWEKDAEDGTARKEEMGKA